MLDEIKKIESELETKFSGIKNEEDSNEVRTYFLGKKGVVSALGPMMATLSSDEKKECGLKLNELRNKINSKLDELKEKFESEALALKLKSESIDVTLPATKVNIGSSNILERIIEEVEELFMSMGYDVVDGPELEEDRFNFELLNIPKGHPARDAQDTFYIEDENILLRSQTSPVQIRTMLEYKGEKPVRMICPGKTYRRDDDDATHSHQFMQIEGLLVDKNISLCDLKGTFDVLAKKLFGPEIETRFRPSYYQFTEPSVETDISCFNCHGKGCNICKNTGWITVSGAGMVHPNVLRNCGYDPEVWTGFAFGFGAERLAMLKYGINDIRTFYMTDLRELKNFDRKEINND